MQLILDNQCIDLEDIKIIINNLPDSKALHTQNKIKHPTIVHELHYMAVYMLTFHQHCVYYHNIGSYIWACRNNGCKNTVYVQKGLRDLECVDASPNDNGTGQRECNECSTAGQKVHQLHIHFYYPIS